MALITKKMDLFEAPKGSILVHACNAQGVWGSGIAKEMKARFPIAFQHYNFQCEMYKMLGDIDVTTDKDYVIASIITSDNYASKVDSPDEILVSTTIALNELCKKLTPEAQIYSNKFNSGLFKVPWDQTEKILTVFVNRYNLNWTVCEV
jgi:ADP-ribose 1''-phosphate phosphatase